MDICYRSRIAQDRSRQPLTEDARFPVQLARISHTKPQEPKMTTPPEARCEICKKPLSTQEISTYRSRCEECWSEQKWISGIRELPERYRTSTNQDLKSRRKGEEP